MYAFMKEKKSICLKEGEKKKASIREESGKNYGKEKEKKEKAEKQYSVVVMLQATILWYYRHLAEGEEEACGQGLWLEITHENISPSLSLIQLA